MNGRRRHARVLALVTGWVAVSFAGCSSVNNSGADGGHAGASGGAGHGSGGSSGNGVAGSGSAGAMSGNAGTFGGAGGGGTSSAAGQGGRGGAGAGGGGSGGGPSGGGGGGLGGGGTGGTGGASGTGGAAGSIGAQPVDCNPACVKPQSCVFPACGTYCQPLGPTGAACSTENPPCVAPGAGPGCTLPLRCTSPPPFCIDLPAGCSTCACLPADVCKGHGQCKANNRQFMDVGNYVNCGS